MAALVDIASFVVAAAEGGGGAAEEDSGGNFLVSPSLGLMIWTLIAFGLTVWVLNRRAYPWIAEKLDARRQAIEDSIDHAERTRKEADELLAEYRERLREAREQAEDIVSRARKAADRLEDEAKSGAKRTHEELMEQTRRDIELETQRSLDNIRREVANLTVVATEKVARKSLTEEDQRRLVDEALAEIDFSALAGSTSGGSGSGGSNGSEGD
ncbi:MAG TPA: F0F1 ATP synthase subunit B [Thermoleophilaceae bacterium]